jgi:hypothetical protein
VPAISLNAYARFLDQLAEQIKTERDANCRTKLLADFRLVCAESQRLNFAEELENRGVRIGEHD